MKKRENRKIKRRKLTRRTKKNRLKNLQKPLKIFLSNLKELKTGL